MPGRFPLAIALAMLTLSGCLEPEEAAITDASRSVFAREFRDAIHRASLACTAKQTHDAELTRLSEFNFEGDESSMLWSAKPEGEEADQYVLAEATPTNCVIVVSKWSQNSRQAAYNEVLRALGSVGFEITTPEGLSVSVWMANGPVTVIINGHYEKLDAVAAESIITIEQWNG